MLDVIEMSFVAFKDVLLGELSGHMYAGGPFRRAKVELHSRINNSHARNSWKLTTVNSIASVGSGYGLQ